MRQSSQSRESRIWRCVEGWYRSGFACAHRRGRLPDGFRAVRRRCQWCAGVCRLRRWTHPAPTQGDGTTTEPAQKDETNSPPDVNIGEQNSAKGEVEQEKPDSQKPADQKPDDGRPVDQKPVDEKHVDADTLPVDPDEDPGRAMSARVKRRPPTSPEPAEAAVALPPKEEPGLLGARRRATSDCGPGGPWPWPGLPPRPGDSDGRGQTEVPAGRPHSPPPMRLPADLPENTPDRTGGHRCRARGRGGRLGDSLAPITLPIIVAPAPVTAGWRCSAVASDGAGAEFAPRLVGRAARRQAGTGRRDGQQCERPARVIPGRLHRIFADCRNLAGRGLGSAWACGHAGTHRCGRIGWVSPGQGRPCGTRRRQTSQDL